MPLPVILAILSWIGVYGVGAFWLWRSGRWTPRRHLVYFLATTPILMVGLLIAAWGSGEAITLVVVSFPIHVGVLAGTIWIGIRRRERRERELGVPDTELRWDLKQ